MAQQFNKGPNVYRQEIDISEIVSPASTSVGAIVAKAKKGRANERILLSNDKEYVDKFGEPNDIELGVAGYGALEFLKESNSLYVVRPIGDNATEQYANLIVSTSGNAVTGTDISVTDSSTLLNIDGYTDGNKPDDIYDMETAVVTGTNELFIVGSVGPGEDGEDTGIKVITSATTATDDYDWANSYDATIVPFITKIEVYRKLPEESSFAGDPVETFYVSGKRVKDGSGKTLYIKDVINGNSEYIYVDVNSTLGNGVFTAQPENMNTVTALQNGGTDSTSAVSDGDITSAWSLFNDVEKVSVNILICTDETGSHSAVTQAVAQIAGTRMDCIAVAQAGDVTKKTTANIIADADYSSYPSYLALYGGWDQIYDKFNDRNVYVPKCIFGAAIMAKTDRVANTWDAPAGLNRGQLPVVGQNIIFNGTEIGRLYDSNINSSRQFPGVGHVLWGQKTAQRKRSALDRINVRRLLLFIQNSVEPTLQFFLFEPNTDKTRARVFNIVDSFMKTVEAGQGVTDYEVVVDETNNTPQVIDNNQMNVDIYVQPSKTAEFIQLRTVITRSGVDFQEVRL